MRATSTIEKIIVYLNPHFELLSELFCFLLFFYPTSLTPPIPPTSLCFYTVYAPNVATQPDKFHTQ